ncbi:MAG TPA: hypothetical protein VJ767_07360 [Nitrososphaeraceae archaeon]|nr:hypothetical protein [Nitrososphaeraceae archaeon]
MKQECNKDLPKDESHIDLERSFMSDQVRYLLVIYFILLISISIILLVLIWNPVQGSLTAVNFTNRTIIEPDGNTTTITTKNSSSSSEIKEIKSVRITADNKTIRDVNMTIKPLTGQAFKTDPEIVFSNPEVRLVIFASFFGIIGASIHGIGSLTEWMSTRKLESGWAIWYLTRPAIGAALALITYILLRAGFVTGGPTAISDFGVAGLSALVGLMTDEMTKKLRDVFDTLFGIQKPAEEKGEEKVKKNLSSISFAKDQNTQIKVNEEIELKANVTDIDGKPAAQSKVHFVNSDTDTLEFIGVTDKGTADVTTTHAGVASIKIKGIKPGMSTITASHKVVAGEEEKETTKNITIEVI